MSQKIEIVFESDDDFEIEEKKEDYKTWTITFSESVENHAGMEQIGKISNDGISLEELNGYRKKFEEMGCITDVIDIEKNLPEELRDDTEAELLIVRGGIKSLLNDKKDFGKFIEEVRSTEKIVDTKAWMRGRVVNKLARYNLCYGEESQKANYEEKKGTVVAFKDVPFLAQIRKNLEKLGDKCKNLLAELNYYYNNRKCGIGFHGDSERRIVIGLRIGSSMDLQYQWFHKGKPVGDKIVVALNDGDLYVMSEKAVGTDWKKRKIPTLRHAAGCKKYTTIKE